MERTISKGRNAIGRRKIMQVSWLIEEDLLDSTELLIAALKRAEIPFKTFKYSFSNPESVFEAFPREACVVFSGSLNCGKLINRKSSWIPGAYYNIHEYDCVNYYSVLGEHLLNSDYIMLPFQELLRQKEFLFDKLGEERALFIRPNRGDKIFTGKVVYKEYFEDEIQRFSWNTFSSNELVVVAKPQNILYEWRFVVGKGRVISGSQYKRQNSFIEDPSFPTEAAELAEKISTLYTPDSVYIVDICQTMTEEYRVMEIGAFSCAGLYLCNYDKVVRVVSRIAAEEYEEEHS